MEKKKWHKFKKVKKSKKGETKNRKIFSRIFQTCRPNPNLRRTSKSYQWFKPNSSPRFPIIVNPIMNPTKIWYPKSMGSRAINNWKQLTVCAPPQNSVPSPISSALIGTIPTAARHQRAFPVSSSYFINNAHFSPPSSYPPLAPPQNPPPPHSPGHYSPPQTATHPSPHLDRSPPTLTNPHFYH